MGFEALAIALLGSGGLGAIFVYLIQRRKAPAEVDSIIVTGAESAVLSLQKANEAAIARAVTAEADASAVRAELADERERSRRKDARIESLEGQLDRAQAMLDAIRAELAAVRRGDDDLPRPA